jgi:LysR family glycine cleavage system transcriptional activator
MTLDWRQLPPLTALRAFEATARRSGFSPAARELNVTHAAVAQQVRALEEHLGIPLVRRDGRALALTEEGTRLAQALSEGFGTIQSALEALRDDGAGRTVRITLTSGFAAQWLMPRLRDFWAQHPEIPITLHPDGAVVDLRRERMDLGIRYGNGSWPGVESRFLTSARLVVAGAPSLIGARERLSVEEMAALPWVLTRDWPEQPNLLRSYGLTPATLRTTELPNEDLAMAAARQGLGLIVESHALLDDDVKTGRLRVVFDPGDNLPAYFVVTPPGPQARAARIFLDWLMKRA